MAVVNSPNMNLPVPVVGNEAGPQYATDINACMSQIDAHDHTSGQGVQITPSAININADLAFNSMNATTLRSTRFTSQGSPISGTSDLNCLSVSGVDLYYRDGSGNIVRITQSGGVAGSPGSIANLVSPASASYVAINSTFVWQSGANIAANMDVRSATLRNSGANSYGLTLQAPTLSGDVTQTLPAVPAATNFMTIASTGVMGAVVPIAQGISTSMLADSAVTTAKIADGDVTLAKMDSDSVDTAQIVDEAVTPAKMAPYVFETSGTTSSFSTTSATPVDAQNLTIVVSGLRPVLITVTAADGTNPSYFGVTDPSNPPVGFVYIRKAGVAVAKFEISTTAIGTSHIVPASLSFTDFPTAGSHTYQVSGSVTSSPTTTLYIYNAQITAYEL